MITVKSTKLTKENIFDAASEAYIFENAEELNKALEPFKLSSKTLSEVMELLKKAEDNNGPILIETSIEKNNNITIDISPSKPSSVMSIGNTVLNPCYANSRSEVTKSRIRRTILAHRNDDVYRGINLEEIYGRIKKLAKKNEIKLRDAIEDCGVCYTYFSNKICKSQNTVSKKLIANLADYFDVSEEYLLRGDKFIVEHINHPIVDTTTGSVIGFDDPN